MEQDRDGLFRSIYDRYYRILRTVASREGVPYDELDDVVQEAFLAYYRYYFSEDRPEEEKKSLLVRIVKNKSYDYFRRCKSRPSSAMDVDDYIRENEENEALIERNILDMLLEKEYYQQIRDCLLEMKPAHREILILMIVQERPTVEVSRMLGISTAACHTRLHRARKELDRKMRERREAAANAMARIASNTIAKHKLL